MIDLSERLRPLAAAPPPDGGGGLDELRAQAGRRRRHKRVAVVGLSALLIVAIVAGVAVARSTSRSAPPVTAGPLPTVPSVGAAALARGHWTTIPVAPISPRIDPVQVWTGRELIVWGGIEVSPVGGVTNDGAAYDPAAHRWRRIAPAPLSPRASASGVWTGSELVVWGGQLAGNRPAGDGAAYDPATNRWRVLPPSPLSPRLRATLLWTGHQVLVLGGLTSSPSTSGSSSSGVWVGALLVHGSPQAASYDPRTDRWQLLPELPVPVDHHLDRLAAVWTGDRLLEWWSWDDTQTTKDTNGNQEVAGSAGVDLYSYDPATNGWRLDPLATDGSAPAGVAGAFVDEGAVVLPAAYPALPTSEKGPAMDQLRGWTYDVAGGHYSEMPLGQLDDGNRETAWTGAALVSINASTTIDGSTGPLLSPGDGEAWDAAINRWFDLPSVPAPHHLDLAAPFVWTGYQLITLVIDTPGQRVGALGGLELTPG